MLTKMDIGGYELKSFIYLSIYFIKPYLVDTIHTFFFYNLLMLLKQCFRRHIVSIALVFQDIQSKSPSTVHRPGCSVYEIPFICGSVWCIFYCKSVLTFFIVAWFWKQFGNFNVVLPVKWWKNWSDCYVGLMGIVTVVMWALWGIRRNSLSLLWGLLFLIGDESFLQLPLCVHVRTYAYTHTHTEWRNLFFPVDTDESWQGPLGSYLWPFSHLSFLYFCFILWRTLCGPQGGLIN